MIINIKNKKIFSGFTLIEALVAISLLMIAISSPIMLAQKGLSSSILSRDQMIASFLVQDGIESVKNLRDEIALNQELYQVSWTGLNNGNSKCQETNRVCVKSFYGDNLFGSCSEDVEGGAFCTTGEINWLGGKLGNCICNIDDDKCDFDIEGAVYCNIDSSNMNIYNDSSIYASFDTDGLFKRYSAEGNSSDKTKFRRQINIKKIDKNEAEVKARVSWDSPYGIQKIEIKTFIYNFEQTLIPYES